MKLRMPDWKSSWFENQISDRFFQEMSRLEKSTGKNLETSAQWMEQVMIEVGQVAQAMIRLESHDAPDPQIRQAIEKSLRLSALSLHLMITLDNLARHQIPGGFAMNNEPPKAKNSNPIQYHHPNLPIPATPSEGNEKEIPSVPLSPSPRPGLPPLSQMAALHPAQSKSNQRNGVPGKEKEERAHPEEEQDFGKFEGMEPAGIPLVAQMVEISGQKLVQNPNSMRGTIQSLSQQGLSRAEIEMVTGEPRHIIEAVLNHQMKNAGGA